MVFITSLCLTKSLLSLNIYGHDYAAWNHAIFLYSSTWREHLSTPTMFSQLTNVSFKQELPKKFLL